MKYTDRYEPTPPPTRVVLQRGVLWAGSFIFLAALAYAWTTAPH